MTSKEALEQIKRDGAFLKEGYGQALIDSKRTCEHFSEYCTIIEQDLERLEQLEKENQELKMQKNSTMLLMKLMSLDGNIVESALILDKYRKAIEILNRYIDIKENRTLLGKKYYHILILDYYENLTKEEYELLKEVLGE